jgi:diaminopimelate epimerase
MGQSGVGRSRGSQVPFFKIHTSDGYVLVIPDWCSKLPLNSRMVKILCDQDIGIGGVGILRFISTAGSAVAEAIFGAEWFVEYATADGLPGEVSDELLRIFTWYLAARKHVRPGEVAVATPAGLSKVRVPESGILDDF